MPLAKRAIEPTRLSRTTLGKEYKFDLDFISNYTLCSLQRQLACLATQAESIFSEITEECVSVVQKTERLRTRIGHVTQLVGRLNAKAVTVRKWKLFACFSLHFEMLKVSYVKGRWTVGQRSSCGRTLTLSGEPAPVLRLTAPGWWAAGRPSPT